MRDKTQGINVASARAGLQTLLSHHGNRKAMMNPRGKLHHLMDVLSTTITLCMQVKADLGIMSPGNPRISSILPVIPHFLYIHMYYICMYIKIQQPSS